MALLKGKLFAGALFVGVLLTPDTGDTPVVPPVNEVIWTQGAHGGGGGSNGQAVEYNDWRSIDDLFKTDKHAAIRAQILEEDDFILGVIMSAITEEML